ncbi:hypothetical protein QAD02_012811 [Eretmocerus hayati]|uniref:Uncharacterized protein n=1 Tax=Eretmocerus hayati TaxID=131215 RepID=A0ACC2P132_9HYME|nr:hypothetical protein QAD02_012811 [Eretmocerus hayati]
MSKKRSSDPDTLSLSTEKVIVSENVNFEWEENCFLCGDKANPKKKKNLTSVPANYSKEKCLRAFEFRNDKTALGRLREADDLVELKAKYHRECYASILSPGENPESTKNITKPNSIHHDVAQLVFDENVDMLEGGKALFLSNLRGSYKRKLLGRGYTEADTENVRSSFIKSHLIKICGGEFIFYSRGGKAEILLSANLEKTDMNDIDYDHSFNLMTAQCTTRTGDDASGLDIHIGMNLSDNQILHRAACILQKSIRSITHCEFHLTSRETSQEKSEEFIPELVRDFMTWLLDVDEIKNADVETLQGARRCSTVSAECLIYVSNTEQHYVIPPLHLGLMVEIHHDFGSRSLIETLNSYGFCASYRELRLCLTSDATAEIWCSQRADVPSNIIPRSEGGAMIQEAENNEDITMDTIDEHLDHRRQESIPAYQVLSFDPCFSTNPKRDLRCHALKE